MKQKLTFSSMLLIVLETICLFIPYSFIKEAWQYDASAITYHGKSTLAYKFNVNILGVSTGSGKRLAVILIALMLLSFVAFLFSFLQKENKLAKIYYYTPIASFIALIIFTVYACVYAKIDSANWCHVWTINWLFYIIMAMHIVTIVFSILLKIGKFEVAPARVGNQRDIKAHVEVSPADEIMKYNDLLNSGIITQEEFDAKKKQLLGL